MRCENTSCLGVACVVGAWISILACKAKDSRLTLSLTATISKGTHASVRARKVGRRIHAACERVAPIRGTRIVIVAHNSLNSDARAILAQGRLGTGISVIARTLHGLKGASPIVATVDGAGVFIVAGGDTPTLTGTV